MFVKSTRYALVFMILAIILLTAVLDLLPPIEKDTLIYHLAVPKIWLNAGGVIEIPWLENSYFPMNLNLLYMAPLSFDFDIGAKFIHNVFGLLTALLIFLYLKKRISTNWALLGGLVFLSTPLIVRLSASAYVDLGLAFFTTAATLGIIYWQDTGKWIYFILSSIALGLALGTKYNSVFALAFLSCGVLWFYKRSGNGWVKSGGVTFIYAGLALSLFAPWAVKNYIFTGNPTYPLYNQLWGVATYFPERYSVSTHMLREHMFGESYWQTLLIPIRFFFEGRDFSMEYFDGVLNPFLLLLPPLALVRARFPGNQTSGPLCRGLDDTGGIDHAVHDGQVYHPDPAPAHHPGDLRPSPGVGMDSREKEEPGGPCSRLHPDHPLFLERGRHIQILAGPGPLAVFNRAGNPVRLSQPDRSLLSGHRFHEPPPGSPGQSPAAHGRGPRLLPGPGIYPLFAVFQYGSGRDIEKGGFLGGYPDRNEDPGPDPCHDQRPAAVEISAELRPENPGAMAGLYRKGLDETVS